MRGLPVPRIFLNSIRSRVSAPPSKNHNLVPLYVYSAIFYKRTHEEHPVLNFFTLKVTIKNLLFGEFHCLIGKW